jgi:general secretion pathway protein M
MRMVALDPDLRRRVLFVAGNLAACVLTACTMVLPIYGLFAERDEQILDKLKVLARLDAIAAQEKNVQSILSDTSAQMRSGEFLVGPNENVISADLQARLKTLAEAAGAKSRAVQALPVRTVDQIRYSGARIEIFGSLQSIQRAVHAIESAKPYLFTSGAAIKLQTPLVGRQGLQQEPVLQAQLDVFGAKPAGHEP